MNEPAIEVEGERLDMAKGALARRPAGLRGLARDRRLGTLLRKVLLVLVALAMLPIALTILYWPSAVHPVSTLMLKDLVTAQGYDRRWVPIEDIAPVMVNSVIMSEDGQFCFHHGIDIREMKGVVQDALAGESTRGASTIPMQAVKNLFLWQGRSFLRKVLEAPYAIYADLILPKRRIMEIYLNIAEWAPNVYGIEAAAHYHFGRSAKNLTARQAALLAVTLPNPYDRDPKRPGRDMRALADRVQRLAARSGAYVGCVR